MAIFGYDVVGGNGWQEGNYVFASKYSCPAVGNVSKMFVYIGVGVVAGNEVRVGIWKASDLSLVAESAAQQAVGNSWNEVPIVAVVDVEDYWLGANTNWDVLWKLRSDDGAVNQFAYDDWVFGAMPDPFVSIGNANQKMSIYAEYTVAGGGAAGVSGSGGRGLHHGGDKRYKDARVINGWKLRS